MDAFIDRVIERFRQRVYDLLAAGPTNAIAAREEAKRIYQQLCSRDQADLARDPEGFIFLAVANEVNSHERRRAGHSNGHSFMPSFDPDPDAPLHNGANPHTVDQLRKSLGDLPAPCRATLILHRRDKMPLDQIADLLHVSIGEVKQYLRAGLQHCAAGRLSILE